MTTAAVPEKKIETLYKKVFDIIVSSNDKKEREHLALYMMEFEEVNLSRLMKQRFENTKEGLLVRHRTFLIPGLGTLKKAKTLMDEADFIRANVYLKQFIITDFPDLDAEVLKDFSAFSGMTAGSVMKIKSSGKKTIIVGDKAKVPFKLIAENEVGNVFISSSDLEMISIDSPEMDLGIVQEEDRRAKRRLRQNAEMEGGGVLANRMAGGCALTQKMSGGKRKPRRPGYVSTRDKIMGGSSPSSKTEKALFAGGETSVVSLYRNRLGPSYYQALVNDYIGYVANTNKRKLYTLTSAYNKSPSVFASSLFGNLANVLNIVKPNDVLGFRNSKYFLNSNGFNRGNIDALETVMSNIRGRLTDNKELTDKINALSGEITALYNDRERLSESERANKLQEIIDKFNTVYDEVGGDNREELKTKFNRIVAGNILDILFSAFDNENAANIVSSGNYHNTQTFIRDAFGVGPKHAVLTKLNLFPMLKRERVLHPLVKTFGWRN